MKLSYCGLVLDSALDLPGLLPAAPDAKPDLVVRRGIVPAGAAEAGHPVHAVGDGGVLWQVAGVARYHIVPDGTQITVEPAAAADPAAVALLLLHSVFALACALRGDWLLAASAVAIRGRVMAIIGPSAIGKSALAAGLAARGHAVVADGLLRLCPAAGAVTCQVQAPWLLLWPEQQGWTAAAWSTASLVRRDMSLLRVPVRQAAAALPLGAILVPRWRGAPPLGSLMYGVEDGGGGGDFARVARATAGGVPAATLGRAAGHLRWAAAVARVCPIGALDLDWGWAHFATALDRLEAALP
ncbi:hypothetical protein [Zavarzinia sp. CC-PAN008]|uniref:hypothetical protein n=1 Tax=Zavarzinia sp. CC-PAN008 TaxID=3243332 RepID=UPI003F743362